MPWCELRVKRESKSPRFRQCGVEILGLGVQVEGPMFRYLGEGPRFRHVGPGFRRAV